MLALVIDRVCETCNNQALSVKRLQEYAMFSVCKQYFLKIFGRRSSRVK
jgi:hypothetical protein